MEDSVSNKIGKLSFGLFLLSLICFVFVARPGTLSFAELFPIGFDPPELPITIIGSFIIFLSVTGMILSLRTIQLNLVTAILGTAGTLLLFWYGIAFTDVVGSYAGLALTPRLAVMITYRSAGCGYGYWLALCFYISASFLNYYAYFKSTKSVSSSAVYCTKCGLKNSPNTKFCPGCGSPME
jgi:hypothetical protein